jgi:hypothetical protein
MQNIDFLSFFFTFVDGLATMGNMTPETSMVTQQDDIYLFWLPKVAKAST